LFNIARLRDKNPVNKNFPIPPPKFPYNTMKPPRDKCPADEKTGAGLNVRPRVFSSTVVKKYMSALTVGCYH
jgi:hypothetical protein